MIACAVLSVAMKRSTTVAVRRAPASAVSDVAVPSAMSSASARSAPRCVRQDARVEIQAAFIVPTAIGPPPRSNSARLARSGGGDRGAAIALDAAVAHVHDAIGGVGDLLVVRHHDDGLAVSMGAFEELEHFVATGGGDRPRRLGRVEG